MRFGEVGRLNYSVVRWLLKGIKVGSESSNECDVVCTDISERAVCVAMGWNSRGTSCSRHAVFLSGRGKLFVPERREQIRQTLIAAHVPFPDLNALFVSTVEFVCGLLLVLGAVTPLACAMLTCVMVVAIAPTAIHNIKASSPTE